MATNKKLNKLYKNFLIKSLINDIEQWIRIETNDYYHTIYYQINYPDCELRIEKKVPFGKVRIYNKKTAETYHFLNDFNFIFNWDLRFAYKRMKKYIFDKEQNLEYEKFYGVLPLSEIRKNKLKELLDL